MAKILLIESATTMCSVAICDGETLLAKKELNEGFTHAEYLIDFIEQVSKQSVELNKIDALVVSKGPGSYTGLRIGVAAAKGICYALNKPLIAVNTLQAFAHGIAKNKPGFDFYIPMLDARRMEVYTAVYDHKLNEIAPTNALILDENSFSSIPQQSKICFFGDGAAKFKALNKFGNAVFLENTFPMAEYMNSIAQTKFQNNEFENVAYFEPFYLKEFYTGKK